MFRQFEEDPFYRGHFEGMESLHRSMFSMPMMGGFDFGGNMFRTPFPAIGYAAHPSLSQVPQQRAMMPRPAMDPFGNMFGMNNMMGGMMESMQNMQRQMESAQNNANGQYFSQSSVMSYSSTGQGPPKIYQATTSTRQGPGGVKETRKAVRDSAKGIEQMAIGHHINDRGHVIERKHDTKTGEREENQNLYNIDESEQESFDREFRNRMGQFAHSHRPAVGSGSRHHQRALPSSGSRDRRQADGHRRGDKSMKASSYKPQKHVRMQDMHDI